METAHKHLIGAMPSKRTKLVDIGQMFLETASDNCKILCIIFKDAGNPCLQSLSKDLFHGAQDLDVSCCRFATVDPCESVVLQFCGWCGCQFFGSSLQDVASDFSHGSVFVVANGLAIAMLNFLDKFGDVCQFPIHWKLNPLRSMKGG